MILHRHLKAMLHRIGIPEQQTPNDDQWLGLLVTLNDVFRQFEEERHRLKRSLDVHSREVQNLYKELTSERDKTASALACLERALLLLDGNGRPLLVSAEAELLLGWSEAELEGKELFSNLGLDDEIWAELQSLRTVTVRQLVRGRHQQLELDLELQPLVRDRKLTGCLVLLNPPANEYEPKVTPPEVRESEPAPVSHVTSEDLPPVALAKADPEPEPEPEVVPEPEPAPALPATAPGELRILLVESDIKVARASRKLLESLGHQVESHASASEALEAYLKEPFDAILCCENPHGFDALELCRRLRQDTRGSYPYFVLTSADGNRKEATRALEAGVDAFLAKPLERKEVVLRLKVAGGVQRRLSRVYSNLMPKSG